MGAQLAQQPACASDRAVVEGAIARVQRATTEAVDTLRHEWSLATITCDLQVAQGMDTFSILSLDNIGKILGQSDGRTITRGNGAQRRSGLGRKRPHLLASTQTVVAPHGSGTVDDPSVL